MQSGTHDLNSDSPVSLPHRALLLRIWAEGAGPAASTPLWRYSLQDLQTRTQRGFADLETLAAYLAGLEDETKHSISITQTDED